jgi:folate-binding protein YgfZ
MCATLSKTQGISTPAGQTSFEQEYQALAGGAALADRSRMGRLRLTGDEALDLLNRLSTNELMDLVAGQGAVTILTSNKGRIVDLLFVLREQDSLLVLTGPGNGKKVADWIDFYTIIEDVVVEDLAEKTTMLSLAGPAAAGLLGKVAGAGPASVETWESAPATIGGVDATVIRNDFDGLDGFDLLAPAPDRQRLWETLIESGATAVGADALEVVRVERGMPASGRELDEAYNPLEAGLKGIISFTKGCYIGQEVVARLDAYKKVSKHLSGLKWDSNTLPPENARLMLGGAQVGVVITAVRSPLMNRGIGLGYVKKVSAVPGTSLILELDDGQAEAEVVDLPFVPSPETES